MLPRTWFNRFKTLQHVLPILFSHPMMRERGRSEIEGISRIGDLRRTRGIRDFRRFAEGPWPKPRLRTDIVHGDRDQQRPALAPITPHQR